jgi:hypothetical protein
MERLTVVHHQGTPQILETTRGRVHRCSRCEGLHFRFGQVSAVFDTESFLRLANRVHYAATVLGTSLVNEEHVVIRFSPTISLMLDSNDLSDIHRLVQDALRWLDEPWEATPVYVN